MRGSYPLVFFASVAIGGVGCAVAEAGELSPDIDPTVPGVNAGYDPSAPRGDGGAETSSSKLPGPSSSSSGGDGQEDAGQSSTTPPPAGGSKPAQGEVLITEVMYDPTGAEPSSEWFELTNVTASPKTLSGLVLADGANRTHTIGPNVVIAPGAYVVFARNKNAAIAGKVPSAAIVYEYGTGLPDNGGIQLANGSTGGLRLRDGAMIVAEADYGGWYSQSGGSSVQLKTLSFSAAASSSNWCLSLNPWTTGSEKGTPGAPSDCP